MCAKPPTAKTVPYPMRTMQLCEGTCDEVPDEVREAVFQTLECISGLYGNCSEREMMATLVAQRMAKEGWRFCPSFPTQQTTQYARIFDLVHTNMANRLAHWAVLEKKNVLGSKLHPRSSVSGRVFSALGATARTDFESIVMDFALPPGVVFFEEDTTGLQVFFSTRDGSSCLAHRGTTGPCS
jgi:hypothetical protein